MSSQRGQPVIAEIEAASVAAHATIDRVSPVSFAASASKSAGEIMLREAVGETPQQGATGAHSKVGKGHCRSGAPSNSNSLRASLSALEPAQERRRGCWKKLRASSILLAGTMSGKKLRETPNSVE
jgi:hypothetical protein